MSERRPVPRAVLARAAAVLLGAAACVEITTAENGVQSVSLDFLPPSIVAGDTLRDTLGAPLALRARAFDENDAQVEDALFTYGFLPIGSDTGRARRALTVDSATGRQVVSLPPSGAVVTPQVTRRETVRAMESRLVSADRRPRSPRRTVDSPAAAVANVMATRSAEAPPIAPTACPTP